MVKDISHFSVQFRDLMVKVAKEDVLQKKASRLDLISLSSQYKFIIDNINGFIVVTDFTKGLYEYISEGVYSYLGHDFTGYSSERKTDFMISIIKDEDRNLMLNIMLPDVLQYLRDNSTFSTGLDYRFTCCLRLRHANGQYLWFLVDTVLIEVDENGFPLKTLITCTNIHQVKKDDLFYYNVTKKNKDGVYEVVRQDVVNNDIDNLHLTAREIQIINLISKGLTNKQIAADLFISENTVKTHRKSIMQKTGCEGIADLTNLAFSRGLL